MGGLAAAPWASDLHQAAPPDLEEPGRARSEGDIGRPCGAALPPALGHLHRKAGPAELIRAGASEQRSRGGAAPAGSGIQSR